MKKIEKELLNSTNYFGFNGNKLIAIYSETYLGFAVVNQKTHFELMNGGFWKNWDLTKNQQSSLVNQAHLSHELGKLNQRLNLVIIDNAKALKTFEDTIIMLNNIQ